MAKNSHKPAHEADTGETAPATGPDQSTDRSTDRDGPPTYILHHRYLKDSSFENPGAPVNAGIATPRIDIGVQITAQQGGDLFEVELGYRITGTHDQMVQFHAEVTYAGLFEVQGADRDQLARFIYVEAPHRLYPHAAKIIVDMVRDGGLPDLTTEEPDFAAIWHQRGGRLPGPELTLPESTYREVFDRPPQ